MFVSAGVTSPQLIQQNVFSAIGGIMSLFCLGFGNDVDYSFLDVMCRQNKGVARRIFEGSDAAIQLKVRQEIKSINDCNMKINASVEMLVCALHKWQQLVQEFNFVSLLQGFYEEVSSPLLLEVDLRYSENTDFLTKTHYSQLFNGSEIVVAGQLKENDVENVLVEVFAHGVRKGRAHY